MESIAAICSSGKLKKLKNFLGFSKHKTSCCFAAGGFDIRMEADILVYALHV